MREFHICKSMLAWQKFEGNSESTGQKNKLVGNYMLPSDKAYK
jgi:hypothetical protein